MMNSFNTILRGSGELRPAAVNKIPGQRSVAHVLEPLERIASRSANLIANHEARFENDGGAYAISQFVFVGPRGGGTPIRVGIFAGIHGDEPEGVHAVVQFIELLELRPELATGYCLTFIPICNPTGFEDRTRNSRRGRDLNREFWSNSAEPEVRLLQTELLSTKYDGIISLHTDNTCDGFYGIVGGATLTKHLIQPALKAAEEFLPRDERAIIDGLPARDGVIRGAFPGILSAPPKARPRPFEIILETPQMPSAYLKECAFIAALQTILNEYRKLISYAQNI